MFWNIIVLGNYSDVQVDFLCLGCSVNNTIDLILQWCHKWVSYSLVLTEIRDGARSKVNWKNFYLWNTKMWTSSLCQIKSFILLSNSHEQKTGFPFKCTPYNVVFNSRWHTVHTCRFSSDQYRSNIWLMHVRFINSWCLRERSIHWVYWLNPSRPKTRLVKVYMQLVLD